MKDSAFNTKSKRFSTILLTSIVVYGAVLIAGSPNEFVTFSITFSITIFMVVSLYEKAISEMRHYYSKSKIMDE